MTAPYDWRDLATATQHKPTELSDVQCEILRLHQRGLKVRDLATLFGMNDADMHLLIYGPDEPGTV
jgi:hypothetical protein